MSQESPFVSVVMPAYNTERHIGQAIESILAQTYTNFEFLIQNDCATDRTLEIINSYTDPRIKVESNQVNMGASMSRRRLMERATGKYMSMMDSDDMCDPNRLQFQVDFMEANPDISICGAMADVINDDGKLLQEAYFQPLTHDEIKVHLFFVCPMWHPTVMMRLQDIKDNDIDYLIEDNAAEDMVFWSKAIDKVRFANIPHVLHHYRVWGNQMSVRVKKQQASDGLDVMVDRMNGLGVELSEAEKQAYFNIIYLHEYTNDDLKMMKNIYVRLWRGNKRHQKYNPKVLRAFLKNRYTFSCKLSMSLLRAKINRKIISFLMS